MKSKNIASSINMILDEFFLVQKEIDKVTELYDTVLKEVEIALIKKVMKIARMNKTRGARILGISRNTLNRKMKNFGIHG